MGNFFSCGPNSDDTLIKAVETNDLALIRALLEKGYKNRKGKGGNNPLMCAKSYEALLMMLEAPGFSSSINDQNNEGETALMIQVRNKECNNVEKKALDSIILLVSYGADDSIKNKKGLDCIKIEEEKIAQHSSQEHLLYSLIDWDEIRRDAVDFRRDRVQV